MLDELHTYRGRQGADVAMLVRRVREALSENLLCIGTSATMASEGSEAEQNRVVAEVASRLFGTDIRLENVITETLQRVTPEELTLESIRPHLAEAVATGLPETASYPELARHPLAVWVELTLGLEWDGAKWRRAKPMTLEQASRQLAEQAGVSQGRAHEVLSRFLLLAYRHYRPSCGGGGQKPLRLPAAPVHLRRR